MQIAENTLIVFDNDMIEFNFTSFPLLLFNRILVETYCSNITTIRNNAQKSWVTRKISNDKDQDLTPSIPEKLARYLSIQEKFTQAYRTPRDLSGYPICFFIIIFQPFVLIIGGV